METLALASSSARRRELLEKLGLPFLCFEPGLDESAWDELPPPERVVALAAEKAKAASRRMDEGDPRLVLGADTLVCLPAAGGAEIVMGKPAGRGEARRMLSSLAGEEHFVHTGVALLDRVSGELCTARSDSRVRFAAMSAEEIEAYLDTGEWEGAAGAYRIQEAAALYIERVEGSWSGIVGLPLRELYVILNGAGYCIRPSRAG